MRITVFGLGYVGTVTAGCLTELALQITDKHLMLNINGWPELRGSPCRYEGLCW